MEHRVLPEALRPVLLSRPKHRIAHPEKYYFYYKKKHFLDQSIQKICNLHLKTEALSATLPISVQNSVPLIHHPQTNGLTERTNEVIETVLRHYAVPSHRNWHEQLPIVEFPLNTPFKKSIGCTPFQQLCCLFTCLPTSASLLDEMSVSSPRKICIIIILKNLSWIKASNK